ncbi:MAG: hypothetical protein ACR2G2_03380 [Pseudonocardia sp.]
MTTLVLTCPSWPGEPPPVLADAARHAVPARPGRSELAALLSVPELTRLVVAGTDADLAAVVLRLLRTERLAQVAVAYLPASPASAVASVWGLPTAPDAAASVALSGEPDPVPLVRDDVGGVLLGRGELRPMRGVVYCDDQLVLRGQASRLSVTPAAPEGVAVRAARVGMLGLRSASAVGRAVQVGCLSAGVLIDGVAHPRPVTRWTWYRHTEPLRLVRGLPAG